MEATRSQLRYSISTQVGRRAQPLVSADYIVGLTDGEGCFYVNIRPPYNKNGGGIVELNFHIKVKEADRGLLEKVRDSLGCGGVYFQHEIRQNHSQCYRYTVNSHRDILGKIIPFFEKHPLQSSKIRDFERFCRIAELVAQGAHHTKHGIARIRDIKSTMNQRTRPVREIRSLSGNTTIIS